MTQPIPPYDLGTVQAAIDAAGIGPAPVAEQLELLTAITQHKVYRDLTGRSWYRSWTNEVTKPMAELEAAGLISVDSWHGQWSLTDKGVTAESGEVA